MDFNPLDFRKTLSQFATGVSVILTSGTQENFHGITINSLTSVSLSPPLILFCLKSSTQTYELFVKRKNFSINILSETQEELAQRFALSSGKTCSKEEVVFSATLSLRLAGCVAYIHCALQDILPAGDHHIFLCSVTSLERDETKKPLIFYQNQFGGVHLFSSSN